MIKHTQTIRRQLPTNCLTVFDYFVGLLLKGLTFFQIFWNIEKNMWISFSKWIFLETLQLQWSVPVSGMCLWLVIFELFGKM